MALAAFVVSLFALLVAGMSVIYTRRQTAIAASVDHDRRAPKLETEFIRRDDQQAELLLRNRSPYGLDDVSFNLETT